MAQPQRPVSAILGNAAAIAGLRTQIDHLATFDTVKNPRVPTVLIEGETGTGKGLVARVIHASGGRSAGPFIDVNCGAIPDSMVEAELFGFEAGAFTDAKRAKPGLFEAASAGTLFLDEVDALPLAVQSKLLKAIEEKSVRRLGAITSHRVDVKLIAATPRDLKGLVAQGSFRADLYYRLALVILEIPPLRTRREDILHLAEHFCAQHAAAHGLEPKRLDEGARAWLLAHDWPGNVRELSHLIERVTLLCPERDVDRAMLDRLRVPLAAPVRQAAAFPRASSSDDDLHAPDGDEGEEATRIREALARAGGNVVGAARLLGLGRNALRYRMQRLGIERPRLQESGAHLVAGPGSGASAPAQASATTHAATRRNVAPAAPSWEQKSVAVLAIDVVFPEAAADSIAHEPWTVASRWERMIEDRIAGFGGVFLRRSPSRLAAAFGIPRALEQLPQRAVQAALAIQRLLAEAQPQGDREPRPELRMAVHVGALQVDVAAADPTLRLRAVGDTLALPERILGHAGAGEILVSSQVAHRIEAFCEVRTRDLHIGSGLGEGLRVGAVVGRKLRATTTELPSPSGQSWFVGRDRELGLLREAFESATRGAGQVVFVVGEAGIGKSRLLGEFRRSLAADQHLWIEGRCASYATTTAFFPVIDGIRRYFGIDDRDEETGAAAKIQRGVAELGDDLAWTLPFVRQVLSLQAGDAEVAALDSASRRSEIFRALKTITLRIAERQALVLVVEDVHWIDPASEDYLGFIADVIPATRALLVCSHRTGYRHPFGDRSYHVRVTLRPLSTTEMAEITGSVLGTADLPPEVRQLIAEKAEGNPFFVEEMTKSLLEDGSLKRVDRNVVLARDLAKIAVPSTIQDVLIARIDRLDDPSRRAIQVASVIGREFALRLLERITEGGRVRTQVDELRSLELIYEKATHPELAYMFKHALTHDVAYESVLRDRRKALHRTIGLAIEELYADRLAEFYETLAHHFSRGEDWERALLYHERAAAKATENFANRAVIAHCRQALTIADRLKNAVSPERRRRLEEAIGLAAFYVSEYATSADAYARAASTATAPDTRASCLANAALSHLWGHSYDAARRASDETLVLARAHGIKAAEAFALNVQGWQDGITKGDLDGWEHCLAAALEAGQAAGDEGALAFTRLILSMFAEWTGDYRKAVELSEQVIASGRRLRLAHLVVWPAWFLGKAWCCLGEYGSAIARLTEAYEVCDRIGDRAWKARLLNTLGWCFGEIGSYARAREHNERASALALEIGDAEVLANSEINLAGNHLALADVARARTHVEPVLATLAQPGDPWMRWRFSLHAADVLGRILLAEGAPAAALALADEEYAGMIRHRIPKVGVRAAVLRGTALLALERGDEAESALAEAVTGAERIVYPRGAWQALGLLAALKRRAGELIEAETYATRQRALVQRLTLSLQEPELRRQLIAVAGGASDV